MKKQVSKITLKTDKIVTLSKSQSLNVLGGAKPKTGNTTCFCPTDI
ncbi:hypothetical protein GCM10027299_47390 [Larkinella ripae]